MPRKPKRAKAPAAPGESNRTDLLVKPQAVAVPTGQGYGQAQASAAAQQAVPLDNAAAREQAAIAAARTAPGVSVPLSAPTQRPDEPVTAGLPMGPGPGPEVLPNLGPFGPTTDQPTLEVYQILQSLWPSQALASAIEEIKAGG